jgi:polysaccharide biosynthesis/export protein
MLYQEHITVPRSADIVRNGESHADRKRSAVGAIMRKSVRNFVIIFILLALVQPVFADDYVIGEEDMLQISVWGNPELNAHVPVRPDGMISMQLVGDIKASGLTPVELKKSLEKELARYVKSPVVSVMVTAINSFKVYILGDGVSRAMAQANASAGGGGGAQSGSGQITLRRHTTLLQLLAQIGSMSEIDLQNAYLLRNGKKVPVNFENLVRNGDYKQDTALVANDIIYLPGGYSNRIRVTGAIRTPGVIPYAEGMTALDAVLSCGGFTEYASQNSVVVVRKGKEGSPMKNIEVKLKDVMNGDSSKNILLKPGDIITVKTSLF